MPPKAVTRAEFDALVKVVQDLQEEVKRNNKYLFGNGTEIGVDEHLRNVLRILTQRTQREDFIFKTVVGFSLTTFLMLLLNGAIYFIKILPVLDKLAAP